MLVGTIHKDACGKLMVLAFHYFSDHLGRAFEGATEFVAKAGVIGSAHLGAETAVRERIRDRSSCYAR